MLSPQSYGKNKYTSFQFKVNAKSVALTASILMLAVSGCSSNTKIANHVENTSAVAVTPIAPIESLYISSFESTQSSKVEQKLETARPHTLKDEVATKYAYICQSTPLEFEGQLIIPEQIVLQKVGMHRYFICFNDRGQILAQDFYDSGVQRTNVYELSSPALLFNYPFYIQTAPLQEGGVNGLYTQWYPTGERVLEANFLEGELQTKMIRWASNGERILELPLSKGLPHRQVSAWHSNGERAVQQSYEHGVVVGALNAWWNNGEARYSGRVYSGQRQGAWQEWWPNKAQRALGQYAYGQREGSWVWWHDNGVKRAQGSYHGGRKVGVWHYWDRSGVSDGQVHLPLVALQGEVYFEDIYKRSSIEIDSEATQNYTINSIGEINGLKEEFKWTHSPHYIQRFLGITLVEVTKPSFTLDDSKRSMALITDPQKAKQAEEPVVLNTHQTNQNEIIKEAYVVQDFYSDGDRKRTAPYILKDFYEQGRLITTVEDIKNSSIEGAYIQWHKNGGMAIEAYMHNGQPINSWKVWDEQGTLIQVIDHKDKAPF